MVVICLVSLDYTIYMLGMFAIEISSLIGTCLCSLFKTRHNASFPCMKRSEIFATEINMHNFKSSFSVWCIGKMKWNETEMKVSALWMEWASQDVSAHGSIARVVVVSAVKAQLQTSWLMLQACLASQTQDWNPLEMLTLVQVPLMLKLWAHVC